MKRAAPLFVLLLTGCETYDAIAVAQFASTYNCSSKQATSAHLPGGGIGVAGCGRQATYSCSESDETHGIGRHERSSFTRECHEVGGQPAQ
jgi:hypothetical protein